MLMACVRMYASLHQEVALTLQSKLSQLTPGHCIPGGDAAPCVVVRPDAPYIGHIHCGLVQQDAASAGA